MGRITTCRDLGQRAEQSSCLCVLALPGQQNKLPQLALAAKGRAELREPEGTLEILMAPVAQDFVSAPLDAA